MPQLQPQKTLEEIFYGVKPSSSMNTTLQRRKPLEEIFNAVQTTALEETGLTQETLSQPQEKKKTSFRELPKNILPSLGRTFKQIGGAVAGFVDPRQVKGVEGEGGEFSKNPLVATGQTIGTLLLGGLGKAGVIPKEKDTEARFDAIAQFFKERYGSAENLKKTAVEDPVGLAMDVSAVLGGVGALVKGTGTVSKISAFTKAGTTIEKAGAIVEPISAATRPLKPVSRFLIKSANLEKLAERVTGSVLKLQPNSARKIAKANIAGTTPERWLLEKKLLGSNVDETVDLLDDVHIRSKAQVDDSLAKISKTYIYNRVEQTLDILEKSFEKTIGNEKTVERLAALKEKAPSGLTLSEINEVKRLIDDNLDLFAITGDPKAGAVKKGLLNIRQEIKRFIEDKAGENGVKNIKELNKDTQVSKEIKDAILKAETRRTPNNLLSLTDYIIGGLAGVATQDLTKTLGVVIAKRIIFHPRFTTALARGLMKLSDADFKIVEAGLTRQSSPRAQQIIKTLVNEAVKTVSTPQGRGVLFQTGRAKEIEKRFETK